MERLRRAREVIETIMTVVVMPIAVFWIYTLKEDVIELKDSQIEYLKEKNEELEKSQIDPVLAKYQDLKRNSAVMIQDLTEDYKSAVYEADSLKNYLNGPVLIDSSRISFTIPQAREIAKALVTEKYLVQQNELLHNEITFLDSIVLLQHQQISNLRKVKSHLENIIRIND